MFVLSVLVAVLVVRVIGAIDWAAVRGALTKLTWWQPIVLLAVVLVRQVLNALPLALYIRGVSTYKATLNDLGAILMSMIAPPPSDLALRVAMFVSWGVSAAKGLAGTLMNTLTFYVVRFLTPALGFLLLLVLDRPAGLRWLEILFILVALAILAGILLVLRSEALARTVGTRAGQVVRRVGRDVDPEAWAGACLTFRADISATFRRGFPSSLLAYCGMLATDILVLLLCLRFVGVGAGRRVAGRHRGGLPVRLPLHALPVLGPRRRRRADPGRVGGVGRDVHRGGGRGRSHRVAGVHGRSACPHGCGRGGDLAADLAGTGGRRP